MADTEREAFEAWLRGRWPNAIRPIDERTISGSYIFTENNILWEAWRVCAALASRPAEVDDWISVEDRLPTMDESVLVFLPNNGDALVEMDSWGEIYECPVSFSTASVSVGEGWGNNDFNDVSHWRKMPAAPSHTTNKEKD